MEKLCFLVICNDLITFIHKYIHYICSVYVTMSFSKYLLVFLSRWGMLKRCYWHLVRHIYIWLLWKIYKRKKPRHILGRKHYKHLMKIKKVKFENCDTKQCLAKKINYIFNGNFKIVTDNKIIMGDSSVILFFQY